LKEVGALLAYENPEASPLAHFLTQQHRDSVSAALNSAILVSLGQPEKPALETLVKQNILVMDQLEDSSSGSGAGSGKGSASTVRKLEKWAFEDFVG
jgi:hypothetical protein